MTISQKNLMRAALELTDAAKAAHVAYWMESYSAHGVEFHTNEAIKYLEKAAAHLGFTLTKTEALPTEPPATRDPDSGRPSLCEPAATSELSHNF